MFIDKDSIKINNISIGKYLVEAQFQYFKLWGEDTGRSLAGDFTGTLLGVYPKIVLYFRKLTKSELEDLVPILDSATQRVTYYDPYLKKNTTMTTYTGDWTLINKNILENESFNISFISVSKRS